MPRSRCPRAGAVRRARSSSDGRSARGLTRTRRASQDWGRGLEGASEPSPARSPRGRMMRHRRTLGTIALLALTFACAWAAWAGLIPGGGPQPSDCYLELDVQRGDTPGPQVTSNRVVECTDGDACDADATCGNDSCTLRVAVCIGQDDPNLAACTPPAAFRRLKVNKRLLPALPGTMEGSACGGFIDLIVGVKVRRNGRKQAGMLALPAHATPGGGAKPARGRAKVGVKCLPGTG